MADNDLQKHIKQNYIQKEKIRKLIETNAFEVNTRDYGNIEVIDIESINELLEEN